MNNYFRMTKDIFCLMLLVFICNLTDLKANDIHIDKSAQHPIIQTKPSANFFEGAVLGNGGIGLVITTRPDAICFHFGHNNVWDIRIAENNKEKIVTFSSVFQKAKALPETLKSLSDDKDFNEYMNLTGDNYRKPYPRPFPCGTVVLGFDRRKIEVLGYHIFIDKGLCEVNLINENKKNVLQIFVESGSDRIWFRLLDENNQPSKGCFNRLRILPDSQTPAEMPPYIVIERNNDGLMSFTQILPYLEPVNGKSMASPNDKAFRLKVQMSVQLTEGIRYTTQGKEEKMRRMEKNIVQDSTLFVGSVILTEGLAKQIVKESQIDKDPVEEVVNNNSFRKALSRNELSWNIFWQKSGVELEDKSLETIWYWNLYFFNCAVRSDVTCPGLFANWSLGNIGTAWHGDYHLNYNTQQPFWVTFSSNHLEQNLPYVNLVNNLLPVSKQWAKDYYQMRGAFFPHSAYPVNITMHPYPVPDWGWEIFETPWMVQGLWWHYIYSYDKEFLRKQAYTPIREATLFLIDYMKRPDAHGKQWNDNKYHIFPSVPPELYGLQPGFKYNYDTQIDIALVKFVFKAYVEAVKILGYEKSESVNLSDVKNILANMPEYPTIVSKEYGEIYTSVVGENDKIVYNVPANLTHVFPGEEYGINVSPQIYRKLVNTYKAHQNEGGNDIVFLNMQAARLGILDLDKFKRQVKYAMLPNGTVTDMVLQSGGRYDDNSDFDYMGKMGIWFENFALPTVINECLMQSYNGTISLFPNWNKNKKASFSTLRAVGAFLVSAKCGNGEVECVTIKSEKGINCKIINPWNDSSVQIIRNGKKSEVFNQAVISFKTEVNEEIELKKINKG